MLKGGKLRNEKTLGVDVGGTKIGWMFSKNGAEKSGEIPTPANLTNAELKNIIKELVKRTNANSVGIALPGFVQNSFVSKLPNIKNVKNLHFEKNILGAKIFAENDVKCAALAQWWSRGAKKNDSFCIVAPGTGIGGAIVHEGKLLRGKNNCAGEFGHMKILLLGKKENLGKIIQWEEICGGAGIEKQYFERVGKRKSAKEIFLDKSLDAKAICNSAAFLFGVGLANIASALNPNEIIIAGSVGFALMKKYRTDVFSGYRKCAISPVAFTKIGVCKMNNPSLEGAMLLAKGEENEKIKNFLGKN